MKKILNATFFVVVLVLTVVEVWSLECYECNSNDTEECATNPGKELNVGTCDDSDSCVVTITEGETHRGCLSKVIPSKNCFKLCFKCSTPLCNGIDFPLDRRRCYHCAGSDCSDVEKNKILPTPCRKYKAADSCYTDFVDNDNTVRGCLTDAEVSCNNYCKKCNFDACNDEIGSYKHYCYQCGKDEPSCKRPQESMEMCKVAGLKNCTNIVLPGNKGQCFTHYDPESNELTRGCSQDLSAVIGGDLTKCDGDFCNDQCMDIKCVICDSNKDWKCQNQTQDISTEYCPVNTTSCYACEDLAWSLECYQCNSEDTKACATKPGKQLEVDQCEATDTCIIAIIEDNTYRGCLSKIFPTKVCSDICYQCNTTLCNDIDYPEDRRQCYQCAGSSCIDVKKNKIEPEPCTKYITDEKCYTVFVGMHNTVRGCLSDGDVTCDNYCRKCDHDACNDEIGLYYHYCYECSYIKSIPSMSDAACKRPNESSDMCLISGIKNCTNKVTPGNKAKCFTHYVPLTDVVQRGCSQTQGATIGGVLRECYGDFCNDDCIDIKCIVCDSKNDAYCRNNTKYTNPKDCPAMTMSCYACEGIDGHVTRGCGVSPNKWQYCTQCYDDDGCNRKPVRSCYSCTSTKDPNCAQWTDPTLIPVETCKDPDDYCVATALPNSYTKRGCLANVIECTDGDPNCKKCKGSLCNDGVVPALRQSCHQCTGFEHEPCTNEQHPALSAACPINAPTDSCFMYLNDNDELIRGCSTDAAFKKCNKNPEKCMICKDNGCNNWPKYRMDIKCVICDSNKDWKCQNQTQDISTEYCPANTTSCYACENLACKRPNESSDMCLISGLKNCTNKVTPGNKAKCFTRYVALTDVVKRGCSQTQSATIGGQLTECYGDFCNDQCIDIKCIVCDSKDDAYCKNNTKYTNPKDCPAMTTSCYACEDLDGHVTRGCGVSPNKWQYCTQCYDDDGCNRKPVRSCYSCTSTEDPNCAQWTDPTLIPVETCKDPDDYCVATALPNSYTKRGCLANVIECTDGDPNCKKCKGSLCNDGVVPALRQSCHQCTGFEHEPCTNEQHPALSAACAINAPTDSCFMYLNDNDELIRGCSTDAAFKECNKNPEKCMICKDNGCNNWPKYRSPSLSCIKCSESEQSCAWGKESGVSIPCEREVPYFSSESCFIYEHSSEIISRGCTLDNPNNPLESGRTYICTTPGCNGQNKVFQHCLQCNSKTKGQASCASDKPDISALRCSDGTLQLYEDRGCYTKRMQDRSVVRGCTLDLNYTEFEDCHTRNNSCEFCLGQGCNNLKAPSQGNRFAYSVQVILAMNALLAAFIA